MADLNNLQPDFMTVYPSVLHALAHEAAAGRLPDRAAAGPGRSRAAAARDQGRCRARLGVKVINIYGTSEGGGTAVGCDRGSTHISEDQLIVEPVDLAYRPVLPGERAARIYLTNLYNPVLLLIRFEITDEVTLLPGPCPCGSAHRRIADVQGRLDDVFTYQGRMGAPAPVPHGARPRGGHRRVPGPADSGRRRHRRPLLGPGQPRRPPGPDRRRPDRRRTGAPSGHAGRDRGPVRTAWRGRPSCKRFVPLEAAPAPLERPGR